MATDYGVDVSCVDDFSDEFREVGGQRLLAEALVRRITTPRGRNPEDQDYGTDVREYLGHELTARAAARMLSDIKSECVKDERVAAVTARVTAFSVAAREMQLQIDVESAVGETFTLTTRISTVSVELLTP